MFPESITSNYLYKKQIGHGSIGSVYLFENRNNNEKVAIKNIYTGDLDQKQKEKINNEINYMCFFSKYENSIKLIKHIVEDDNIYIIMEYCDMNLDNYIKQRKKENKPLTIIEIKNILIQINNILKILFDNKYAHRDLKPGNILLKKINNDNYIIKLSDYGNAKKIINSSKIQSSFKGTAIFKAPEILDNEENYDAIKADLWCIGIIIYFMLKGEYPFDSDEKINKEKTKLQINLKNCDTLCDLFKKLTYYEPEKRISFSDYFNHSFFKKEKEKIIKIICLGESGCGKTAIINKICKNIFNENQEPTIGIDFLVK